MTIDGTFAVSPTGASTYTIPIELTNNLKIRDNCSFTIHTIAGAEVMNTKVNKQLQKYDLSKLPPGIYLLTLTIKKKKEAIKFIRR